MKDKRNEKNNNKQNGIQLQACNHVHPFVGLASKAKK
jgi:hypothetical protein